MSELVGEARVRVRPDTRGFGPEAARGVRSGLTSAIGRAAAVGGVTVGVAGVVKVLRDAKDAAAEAQTVQLQTAAVLRTAGLGWDQYGEKIEAAANKQAALQAFDDEEVTQGFTRIFRTVKDVDEALRLTAIAGDLATSRMTNGQRDLAGAALIVGKVAGGNVGILKRYGIELKDGATASEALAALQERVAGSAEAFASGQEGAAARLNKIWGDTQEIIGAGLLPVLTDLQNRVGTYLQKANETGETQRRVNEIFGTASKVAQGVADGLGLIRDVGGPVVEVLGGVENAAKLAVLAFAGFKVAAFIGAVGRAAASFGLISASSTRTTAKVVADAAIVEAALDTAYRPRTMVGTVVTTGTPGPILGPNGKPLPPSGKNAPPAPKTSRVPGLLKGKAGVVGLLGALGLTVAGTQTGGEAGSALTTIGSAGLLGSFFGAPGVVAGLAAGTGLAGIQSGKEDIKQVQAEWNAASAAKQQAALNKLGPKNARKFLDVFKLKVKPGVVVPGTERAAFRPGQSPLPTSGVFGAVDLSPPKPKATTASTAAAAKVGPRRLTFAQVQGRVGAFEETQTIAQTRDQEERLRSSLQSEKAFLEAQVKAARLSVEQRRQVRQTLLGVTQQLEGIDAQIAADRDAARDATAQKAEARVDTKIGTFDTQIQEAAARDDLAAEKKLLAREEAWLKEQIKVAKDGSALKKKLRDELAQVHERQQETVDKRIDQRIGRFDTARREAALKSEGSELVVLRAEEEWLRGQIKQTKEGSARRKRLQDELLGVREDIQATDSKAFTGRSPNTVEEWAEQLRGAGVSAAAHITARIRGTAPRAPTGTASGASGSTIGSGSVTSLASAAAAPAVDQLLRDIAVGQAQRDRLQLDATTETNRLLRILVPGAPAAPGRPRTRIEGLTGLPAARDVSEATGGLP